MTCEEVLQVYRIASDTSPDGTSCSRITPCLMRGGFELLSSKQQEIVNQLDDCLRKAVPSKDEIVVYRGCKLNHLSCLPHKPYPSYMSASKKFGEALKFIEDCLVQIVCPPGTKYLNVSPNQSKMSTLEHDEILLPRNCSFDIEDWDVLSSVTDGQKLLVQMTTCCEFKTLTLRLKSLHDD